MSRACAWMLGVWLGLSPFAMAAPESAVPPDDVEIWLAANEHALLDEFEAFVRLPNVPSEPDALRRNAEHLVAMMERRGLSPRLLESADGEPPAVVGTWSVPGATRTLVLYAHYDGQPVGSKPWASDPWTPTWRRDALEIAPEPVVRDPSVPVDPAWRLYARSASDDKAGIMALLAAVDVLRAGGHAPTVNLVFLFDGEEEIGSPHLRTLLETHRDLLAADAWIICDGVRHASGRPQLVFGARGIVGLELTVYGAKRALHSGQYGGFAPNPAMRLARLLGSLQDDTGRVLVDGWYDDVIALGDAEQAALVAAPDDDAALLRDLGLPAGATPGVSLREAITRPALNVSGLRAADVGAEARSIVPSEAHATIDLRLVKGDTVARQIERLTAHVRAQGYHVLDRAPTDEERLAFPRLATLVVKPGGYAAARTPIDLPLARDVAAALRTVTGDTLLLTPTLGGSLPLSVITDTLGAPVLVLPISNPDNRQHAENENLRMREFREGIRMQVAVMRLTARQ